MDPEMPNTLYYGDNLDILRNPRYFKDESVDLIYLETDRSTATRATTSFLGNIAGRGRPHRSTPSRTPGGGTPWRLALTMRLLPRGRSGCVR